MAPEVEARIAKAVADRRLTVMAAKALDISPNSSGASVRYRRRGQAEIERLQVGAVVDCTGIAKNPDTSGNPVIRSLFDQGLARIDPLRMGIEVAPDCAIVNRGGFPSGRLFAVGPLTRAAFWEIVAIPDIRNQCAQLAERILRSAERTPESQNDYEEVQREEPPFRIDSLRTLEFPTPRQRAALVGHH